MNPREQEEMEWICQDIKDISARKSQGYGRNLQRHGMRGVIIRLGDKIQRLENLVLGDGEDLVEEEIEDTLTDIAGYAIRALTLSACDDLSIDGEWAESNKVPSDSNDKEEMGVVGSDPARFLKTPAQR